MHITPVLAYEIKGDSPEETRKSRKILEALVVVVNGEKTMLGTRLDA